MTGPSNARTPSEISSASANTTVEWPSENQNPTLSGRLPSRISLRVVLSIAEMWSASNAWRMPSVYAVIPIPTVNVPEAPRLVVVGRDQPEQHREPEHVQPGDRREHQHQRPPLAALQARPDARHATSDPHLRQPINICLQLQVSCITA